MLAESSPSRVAEGSHQKLSCRKLVPGAPSSTAQSAQLGVHLPQPLWPAPTHSQQEERDFICTDPLEVAVREGSTGKISCSCSNLYPKFRLSSSLRHVEDGTPILHFLCFGVGFLLFSVNFFCSAVSHRTNTKRWKVKNIKMNTFMLPCKQKSTVWSLAYCPIPPESCLWQWSCHRTDWVPAWSCSSAGAVWTLQILKLLAHGDEERGRVSLWCGIQI